MLPQPPQWLLLQRTPAGCCSAHLLAAAAHTCWLLQRTPAGCCSAASMAHGPSQLKDTSSRERDGHLRAPAASAATPVVWTVGL